MGIIETGPVNIQNAARGQNFIGEERDISVITYLFVIVNVDQYYFNNLSVLSKPDRISPLFSSTPGINLSDPIYHDNSHHHDPDFIGG